MYPEVYTLTDNRIAILKKAYDIHVDYELNLWPILRFSLPRNCAQWKYIQAENRIKYGDELFVIRTTGPIRNNDGSVIQEIEAPSIASDLNYKYKQVIGSYIGLENMTPWSPNTDYQLNDEIVYLRKAYKCVSAHMSSTSFDYSKWAEISKNQELVPTTQIATDYIDFLLADTEWSRGSVTVDNGKYRTFQGEWVTVPSGLLEAREKFDGFLRYHSDTLKIDLVLEPGSDNGVTFQYAKNITEISKNIESTEFITRLYVYGDEDLTVNNVNPNKQSHIDNFSYFLGLGYTQNQIDADIAINGEKSRFIKIGFIKWSDYVDELALYNDAKKKLDEELCLPKVTYRIGLVDLSKLTGYSQESFNVGDWVVAKDTEMDIDIKVRIVKMSVYDNQPEKTVVELANATNYVSDVLSDTIDFGGSLKKNKNISTLLRHIINTFTTTINSANGKLVWKDGTLDAIDIDDNGTETGQIVRISPGGIGISLDGGQTFVTAMTGEGVLAERVICNTLHILQIGDEGIVIENGLKDDNIASSGKWNNAVFLDEYYNQVKINTANGLECIRSDKIIRTILNATYGISIQRGDGTGGNWVDKFWVDLNGIIHADEIWTNKIKIKNGEDILIDADTRKIDFDKFLTVIGRLIVKDTFEISNSTTPGQGTIIINKDGIVIKGEDGSKVLLDSHGIDPIWLDPFKNMIFNSQFEVVDETGSPLRWITNGITTTNANFYGSRSLELSEGQTAITDKTSGRIDPSWYGHRVSRVSFHKKYGSVRVRVIAYDNSGNPTDLSLKDDKTGSTGVFLDYAYNKSWWDSRYSFTFTPPNWTTDIRIEFEGIDIDNSTYLDAIMLQPSLSMKWPSIYKDGPESVPLDSTAATRTWVASIYAAGSWVSSNFANINHSHSYASSSDIEAAINAHIAAYHT